MVRLGGGAKLVYLGIRMTLYVGGGVFMALKGEGPKKKPKHFLGVGKGMMTRNRNCPKKGNRNSKKEKVILAKGR